MGFFSRLGRGSHTTPTPVQRPAAQASNTKPFDAYPADSGLPPHLLKQAEENAAYVAIFIGWVDGEVGFMLCTTRSPRNIGRDLQKYNKRPTGHILLWTPGQAIADRIIETLRSELKGLRARPLALWYDDMRHEKAIAAVRTIARKWNVWIASTEERDQMLQAAVSRAIEQHKQLEKSGNKPLAIPFAGVR